MDTVYGTKKYFQSLSGASDIYRPSTCRAVTNDYSSYQNTMGRRSSLAPPYTHMNKHPAYSTDLSIGSQYGYNSWGIWRDPRNVTPSTYSSKSRQSIKSFSIILTTAAFIVLLAVISIAGLAFYFSTIKSNLDDPIMAFEGSFRVSKGDIFTTGLKHNHTSTYKQKHDFYKRFVERALSDNGLQIVRIDIVGFGDGPLVNPFFRAFLDMRKFPQDIHSVEEHIRESLFLETTSMKSLYKSLKIDPDSVNIKRILDNRLIKSATFSSESVPAASQTHFEKRLTKKTGTIEKSFAKVSSATTTRSPSQKPSKIGADEEPEVDVENAPVIQGSFEGSFEITKTDADITRKKTSPTKSVTTPAPAITAVPIRVKTKKTTIEKVTQPIRTTSEATTERSSVGTSSVSSTTTSTTMKTTTAPTTTTPKPSSSTSSTFQTHSLPPESTFGNLESDIHVKSTTESQPTVKIEEQFKISNSQNPPRLDTNLFASAPVLDTEPWRPIRPSSSSPTYTSSSKPELLANLKPTYNQYPSQSEIEAIESGLLPRNKIKFSDHATSNPNEMIFYHSFTNPVFKPGTSGIERLGNSEVKPHPLPIPLIDEVVIPSFKPLGSITADAVDKFPLVLGNNNDNNNTNTIYNENDKFEHIGGGVIVKKHDNSTTSDIDMNIGGENFSLPESDTTGFTNETNILDENSENKNPMNNSMENSESIGELLFSLLDVPKENNESSLLNIESRIEPDSNEKPNFLNIKEHVLSRNKFDSQITAESTTIKAFSTLASDASASAISSTSSEHEISATSINTDSNITTAGTPFTRSTTVTLISTTIKPLMDFPTKRNRIKTRPTTLSSVQASKTTPVTLDDSLLFPSHSKWEYVNGSSALQSSTVPTNMRRVFNETLQAWLVENIDASEYLPSKDATMKANNTADIQDISLIFDTLASKLGISPSIPTKNPPFSQNKIKNAHRNDSKNKVKIINTAKPITITKSTYLPSATSPSVAPSTAEPATITTKISSTMKTMNTKMPSSSSLSTASTATTTSSTISTLKLNLPFATVPHTSIANQKPSAIENATVSTELPSSILTSSRETLQFPSHLDQAEMPNLSQSDVIFGEAEVEVVDPNKYEEMLSSQSTNVVSASNTPPTLVTLLPVRSNSGIRTFRPPVKQSKNEESRRFLNYRPRFQEAIVKTGIHVTT